MRKHVIVKLAGLVLAGMLLAGCQSAGDSAAQACVDRVEQELGMDWVELGSPAITGSEVLQDVMDKAKPGLREIMFNRDEQGVFSGTDDVFSVSVMPEDLRVWVRCGGQEMRHPWTP